jgi:hypothetical protein
VSGGHLPRFAQVDLAWVAGGKKSPMLTTAQTDGRGVLTARFVVPAVRPGYYQIAALVRKVRVASTSYHVILQAVVDAAVRAGPGGDQLRVTGRRFAPGARVLLAAYPMFQGTGPVTLGVVRASSAGRIRFVKSTRRLTPGEYELRAWSLDFVTVDLADAFFQVVV